MPRIATGIDIISIPRIRRLSERTAFLEKVFTEGERGYSRARRLPWRHLAGRFAAKEAVMKALGAGWGQGIGWKDIEVANNGARPVVALSSAAEKLLGQRKVFISISYSGEFAAALAVIE